MSLNLGLESLGFDVGNYSFEDLLAEQVDILHDLQDADMAFFDLMNTAKDVSNFNEIVNSLRNHASQECMDFATDLLGTQVSLEAEEVKIPGEKKGKVMGALDKAWSKIKEWARKIYEWCKKYVMKALRKLDLVEQTAKNPEVTVHWKTAELQGMVDELGYKGKVGDTHEVTGGATISAARKAGSDKYLDTYKKLGEKKKGAAKAQADYAKEGHAIEVLTSLLKLKVLSRKPKAIKLVIGYRSNVKDFNTGAKKGDKVSADEAKEQLRLLSNLIQWCYNQIRTYVDGHEAMATWSHKRLALTRALVTRLQSVMGYAATDISNIGKVTAGSANAIMGKYDKINSKREDLDKELKDATSNVKGK